MFSVRDARYVSQIFDYDMTKQCEVEVEGGVDRVLARIRYSKKEMAKCSKNILLIILQLHPWHFLKTPLCLFQRLFPFLSFPLIFMLHLYIYGTMLSFHSLLFHFFFLSYLSSTLSIRFHHLLPTSPLHFFPYKFTLPHLLSALTSFLIFFPCLLCYSDRSTTCMRCVWHRFYGRELQLSIL